jgi:murein DD-endopeptidase MepM/ murein hydrolase activator NlpD
MSVPNSDYEIKTKLALPFKGTWIVGNGGRSHETNNHVREDGRGAKAQLYAYDFLKNHSAEGKKLEDYEAFGSEVIAPADGLIVQVIDGSYDVSIGERDLYVIPGNAIVIDHLNGEYSALAHFKNSSIKVKVGDKVKQGDILGLCGNTGNTSEPHIHYHLQDDSSLSKATGLPAAFTILVDGELKENFEPTRGQKISNP